MAHCWKTKSIHHSGFTFKMCLKLDSFTSFNLCRLIVLVLYCTFLLYFVHCVRFSIEHLEYNTIYNIIHVIFSVNFYNSISGLFKLAGFISNSY